MERVTADVGEGEKYRRAADDVLEGTIGRKWFQSIESRMGWMERGGRLRLLE